MEIDKDIDLGSTNKKTGSVPLNTIPKKPMNKKPIIIAAVIIIIIILIVGLFSFGIINLELPIQSDTNDENMINQPTVPDENKPIPIFVPAPPRHCKTTNSITFEGKIGITSNDNNILGDVSKVPSLSNYLLIFDGNNLNEVINISDLNLEEYVDNNIIPTKQEVIIKFITEKEVKSFYTGQAPISFNRALEELKINCYIFNGKILNSNS